jgi:endogenous inhibitor of DNA gyrase (YacG/DUF329 family)
VIVLTCPVCSKDFKSAIQADRASFDTTRFDGNTETCPHCGAPVNWTGRNARWED